MKPQCESMLKATQCQNTVDHEGLHAAGVIALLEWNKEGKVVMPIKIVEITKEKEGK